MERCGSAGRQAGGEGVGQQSQACAGTSGCDAGGRYVLGACGRCHLLLMWACAEDEAGGGAGAVVLECWCLAKSPKGAGARVLVLTS